MDRNKNRDGNTEVQVGEGGAGGNSCGGWAAGCDKRQAAGGEVSGELSSVKQAAGEEEEELDAECNTLPVSKWWRTLVASWMRPSASL